MILNFRCSMQNTNSWLASLPINLDLSDGDRSCAKYMQVLARKYFHLVGSYRLKYEQVQQVFCNGLYIS